MRSLALVVARSVFACAACLSLLVGVTVIGLWVRSYRANDDLEGCCLPLSWDPRFLGHSTSFRSSQGGVNLSISWPTEPVSEKEARWLRDLDYVWVFRRLPYNEYPWLRPDTPPLRRTLGMDADSWQTRTNYGRYKSARILLPYWLVDLPFLALPALWVRRRWRDRRRQRRMSMGLCLGCGYDVRGGGERCPECGAAVPAPTAVRVEAAKPA